MELSSDVSVMPMNKGRMSWKVSFMQFVDLSHNASTIEVGQPRLAFSMITWKTAGVRQSLSVGTGGCVTVLFWARINKINAPPVSIIVEGWKTQTKLKSSLSYVLENVSWCKSLCKSAKIHFRMFQLQDGGWTDVFANNSKG